MGHNLHVAVDVFKDLVDGKLVIHPNWLDERRHPSAPRAWPGGPLNKATGNHTHLFPNRQARAFPASQKTDSLCPSAFPQPVTSRVSKQPLPARWGVNGDSVLALETLDALSLSQGVAASPRAGDKAVLGWGSGVGVGGRAGPRLPLLCLPGRVRSQPPSPRRTCRGWLQSPEGLRARPSPPTAASEQKCSSWWERQRVSRPLPLLVQGS